MKLRLSRIPTVEVQKRYLRFWIFAKLFNELRGKHITGKATTRARDLVNEVIRAANKRFLCDFPEYE